MDPKRKREIWKSVRDLVIDQLKGEAIKQALKFAAKSFLNSGAALGIKGWLIKFVVTELFEEVGEPVFRAALVEAGYQFDRYKGQIQIKRIEEARENGDGQAYDDAVDDVFGSRRK